MARLRKAWELMRNVWPGLLLLFAGIWFWQYAVEDPLDELALIRNASVANAVLIESGEAEAEDERGRVYFFDKGLYEFRVPSGHKYSAVVEAPSGELKDAVQVEYLPEAPEINRVRGTGCTTILDWFFRKVLLGSLLLAICVAPGVSIIRASFGGTRYPLEP